jgi:hypothetical protein
MLKSIVMKNKLMLLFFAFILFCCAGMAKKIISGTVTTADKVYSYNLPGSYSIDRSNCPLASSILVGINVDL